MNPLDLMTLMAGGVLAASWMLASWADRHTGGRSQP